MESERISQLLNLELLILGPEARGADDRKAWPPTRPPVLAADAGSTEPSVSTPAANATNANFAILFSFFLQGNGITDINNITNKFEKKTQRVGNQKAVPQGLIFTVWVTRAGDFNGIYETAAEIPGGFERWSERIG